MADDKWDSPDDGVMLEARAENSFWTRILRTLESKRREAIDTSHSRNSRTEERSFPCRTFSNPLAVILTTKGRLPVPSNYPFGLLKGTRSDQEQHSYHLGRLGP